MHDTIDEKDITLSVSADGDCRRSIAVEVSHERFAGEKLIGRHRAVNGLLRDELGGGLHALAIHAWTPEEWFEKGGGPAPASPAPPRRTGGGRRARRLVAEASGRWNRRPRGGRAAILLCFFRDSVARHADHPEEDARGPVEADAVFEHA